MYSYNVTKNAVTVFYDVWEELVITCLESGLGGD